MAEEGVEKGYGSIGLRKEKVFQRPMFQSVIPALIISYSAASWTLC